jgi:hypothetical protein
MTADDFSSYFMSIYEGVAQKVYPMAREESLELANFLTKSDRSKIGPLLCDIYGSCDSFSPDPDFSMSDEKELKDCAQLLLLKFQEE